jgi:hypothetical protein
LSRKVDECKPLLAGVAAAAMAYMLAALLPGVAASRRDTVYEDRVLGRALHSSATIRLN